MNIVMCCTVEYYLKFLFFCKVVDQERLQTFKSNVLLTGKETFKKVVTCNYYY